MTVISTDKNTEELTLTFVSEFDAPVERVWQVWEDPRTLERWWGPPTYPATFLTHELVAGGTATYYMQGPEGDRFYGWWDVERVAAPTALEFTDGFADETGARDETIKPSRSSVTLEPAGAGTRMTIVASFPDLETLEKQVEMGMLEGMTQALGQIDALLA
jgi:uncharacterized protein YndB with AHSA1/START domain